MKAFLGIYQLTVKGIWRERWPWLVLPLMAVGFFVARLLASFTIGRDEVVTLDFGLVFIGIIGLLCTLYMVHLNWNKELESPSAAFLLTRPVSRHAYVLGRFAGMATILVWVLFSGALTLVVVAGLSGVAFNPMVFVAVYGTLLTLLILLSFGTLSAHLSTPVLGLVVSVLFYLSAMLSDAAVEFFESRQQMAARLGLQDPQAGLHQAIARFMEIFMPQIARLNFKEMVILDGAAPMPVIPYFHLTLYALTFIGVFLAWGLWLFERREFP